jgi:hypothetical protein
MVPAWLLEAKVSLPARWLAVELLNLGALARPAYPSLAYLGLRLGLRERWIRNLLRELEAAGILTTFHQEGRSSQYRIRKPTPAVQCRTPRQWSAGDPGSTVPPDPYGVIQMNDPEKHTVPFALTSQDEPRPARGRPVRVVGGFEEFWKAWPWKRNRKAAERAFRDLNPDRALLDRILAWIPRYRETDSVQRGAILHASTALRHRRWEDEIGPKAPATAKPADEDWQRERARFLRGFKESSRGHDNF